MCKLKAVYIVSYQNVLCLLSYKFNHMYSMYMCWAVSIFHFRYTILQIQNSIRYSTVRILIKHN